MSRSLRNASAWSFNDFTTLRRRADKMLTSRSGETFRYFITVCVVTLAAFIWTLQSRHSVLRLPVVIDFSRQESHGVRLRGFSHREDWGRWTIARTASIEFSQALPLSFRLRMKMKAFGPNIDQLVVVRCDKLSRSITAAAELTTVEFVFSSLAPGQHSVTMEIPEPASPEQLGISKDPRLLGIGIQEAQLLPSY